MQNMVEISMSCNVSNCRGAADLEIKNWKLEIPILLQSNKIVDTLVVHAVNDGCWLLAVSTLPVAKLTR